MNDDEQIPRTEELRIEQAELERAERLEAEESERPDAARAASRRADKAGYLRDKLDAQAASQQDDES